MLKVTERVRMAPVRDREGERRGWYWLEDEAYLFLAGGVRSFGWTEKVFDTTRLTSWYRRLVPRLGFPTNPSRIFEPRRNLLVRDTVFSVNFQRKLWVGYRRNLDGNLAGLRNPRRNLGWGDASLKIQNPSALFERMFFHEVRD